MNYREKIRKAIACPQFGDKGYGEWGALRYDQRVLIKRLLDELDSADEYIKSLDKVNKELKYELKDEFNLGHELYYTFSPLRIARFSSLENCFVFLYSMAIKNKCDYLKGYFDDVMRSIRGFDTEDIQSFLKNDEHLNYIYNEWIKRNDNKKD